MEHLLKQVQGWANRAKNPALFLDSIHYDDQLHQRSDTVWSNDIILHLCNGLALYRQGMTLRRVYRHNVDGRDDIPMNINMVTMETNQRTGQLWVGGPTCVGEWWFEGIPISLANCLITAFFVSKIKGYQLFSGYFDPIGSPYGPRATTSFDDLVMYLRDIHSLARKDIERFVLSIFGFCLDNDIAIDKAIEIQLTWREFHNI